MSSKAKKKTGREKMITYPTGIKHPAEKCRKCPYGKVAYCVGICWKDAYDSVLKKREAE